jgi:hypothetical protein
MVIRSQAFLLDRGGGGLNTVRNFISQNIGRRAFVIKSLEASSYNSTTTVLNLLYEDYVDNWITSISPKENYIISTGVDLNDLSLFMLFTEPVASSALSGAVVVDGSGLDTGRYRLSGKYNNYSLKVNLNGFGSTGNHSYYIDNRKIRQPDGTEHPLIVAGGYTVHTHASPYLSDSASDKILRRGEIAIDHLYLNNSIGIQNTINQYLVTKNVRAEDLITYSFTKRSENNVDLYILYISAPEPQIIKGYPGNNDFVPFNRNLSKIRLTFSTELSRYQINNYSSLFVIEAGYNTYYDISSNIISLLPDDRTVEISIDSLSLPKGIYTVVAKPGLLSNKNIAKQSPDHWTVVIDSYEGGSGSSPGGSGDANMNDVMRRISFRGMGA